MAELKTFLFTDLVGSVELKREMPGTSDTDRDQAFIELVLTPHRERIERELAALGGRVVSTAGDGHFLVFSDTVSAARWAIGIQRSHRDEPIRTPGGRAVAVRISMHLGIPQIDPHDPNNFVGKPVDYAARLSDYATSGQILASRSVVAVLEDAGMDGVSFHRHGRRELRGIGNIEVYELVYDRQGPRAMRAQPRASLSRQWTVRPATMGLSEFGRGGWGRGSASPQRDDAGGERGARPQASMAPNTDVVPWRLGNYELEARLGSGGMGDVYKARHVQFGRVRAVKVIKQHFVDTGHHEVIRRFYQEIKAVGQLEHPNIVVAIDSSAPSDAVHYLVMEYIDGVGVDELVSRRGQVPVAAACEIARQAARGLAYIHQHGMVHRDIKPSNLMVTLARTESADGFPEVEPDHARQPVVKILDLGLALLVGDDQQRLTMFDNRAMGTAMYMSPEQWKTTSVDIRADIYSLGCTLYHLLSGKPPFWESDLKPEKAHEREKLPPIRAVAGREALPRGVWDVLVRMTAKDPHERYSDPAEITAALAPFAEGHRLAQLIAELNEPASRAQTQGVGRSDTLVAKSAESDTLAQRPRGWSGTRSLTAQTRRKISRATWAVATLAAVAAIGWLALAAWQQQSRSTREVGLQLAANYAGGLMMTEINERFATLHELARDRDLRTWMLKLETAENEEQRETVRKQLEQWLGTSRSNRPGYLHGESWFVNDRVGTQVARSPQSARSTGRNYAHRDYFHGRGHDLPEGTTGLQPIDAAHVSAVYRSTSDGSLRVAFSVPIDNGRSGAAREVIGVLAMSVDLNDFDVLERRRLPEQYQIVLIDMREQTTQHGSESRTGRGLLLHQQGRAELDETQPPQWAGPELLALLETARAQAASRTEGALMLPPYQDEAVTGGRQFSGAVKPVVDPRPTAELRDTGWFVLVQEPL